MNPALPIDDLHGVPQLKAKGFGYKRRRIASGVFGPDFSHEFGREGAGLGTIWSRFRVAVNDYGILVILGVRGPLQVFRDVVAAVVVKVGDLRKSVWVGNEGQRYGSVDADVLHGAISADGYPKVSIPVGFVTENPPRLAHRFGFAAPLVSDDAIETSHASAIARLVKAFIARNCAPLFVIGHAGIVGGSDRKINSLNPALWAQEV